MKNFFRYWFPVILWAGVIFLLSQIPNLKSDLPSTWDLVFRKIAHATEYGLLSLLLLRAFRSYPSDRGFIVDVVAVLTIVVAFALSDEIHQAAVPGRHGSFIDICIDSGGAFLGLVCVLAVRQKRLLRLW